MCCCFGAVIAGAAIASFGVVASESDA
eukprot:COSAG06_NODE_66031_length_255_cov_0.961538_1_plen_26_part_10